MDSDGTARGPADGRPSAVAISVDAAIAAILADPRVRDSARPVILIDGRSGSGKSVLAAVLATALAAQSGSQSGSPSRSQSGSQLVHLDDIYPGWRGLESASRMVRSDILERHRWRRWDWISGAPAEWHELDPKAPLVVEGCGTLSRANRALASLGVWVELDEPTRKTRALARDGAAYEAHWDAWAAAELAFSDREHPKLRADVVVAG